MNRITAIYRVKDSADTIKARAHTIAVEQSVEMPVTAISKQDVLDNIVGRVDAIRDLGNGMFEVRIGLAVSTTGLETGQMMNMLFGNTSLHEDVVLYDAEFPEAVTRHFGGPNVGLDGLRKRAGAGRRALTCSALKPQGFSPAELAALAAQFARGGLDFIKDDHGLADQAYSPFAERVPRVAEAVRKARTGGTTCYLPTLNGHLDSIRAQVKVLREAGLNGALIAPMLVGLPAFHAVVRENPDLAFMAHPALGGAARIAPPLLFGKIFRLLGADATVFPNHGGRFGYSPDTCTALARAALSPWDGLKSAVPVPAGGMTTDRVPQMLDFYGADVMLLIGGGLLSAGARLTEETAAFTAAVRAHGERTV